MIAAIAAVSGAGLSAYASLVSSKQAKIESCVKRFDIQETKIREKAAVLLGEIGNFVGASAKADKDVAPMYESGTRVIKSAFELTAHTPLELSYVSLHIAWVINMALTADTAEEKNEAIAAAGTALKEWPKQYDELMAKFQQNRAKCEDQ